MLTGHFSPTKISFGMQQPSSPPLPITNAPPSPPSPPPKTKPWQGAKPIQTLLTITFFLILRFAVPKPHRLTHKSWSLLSIFLSTILGLILSPLSPAPLSFIALTLLLTTKTLTFKSAMTAFTNEVIWLILVSFFFARGVVKTGLGERVATCFVALLGKSTLGLSYGLVVGEAMVAPAMPSSTARAGGIFYPVIKSLALGNGSCPKDTKSSRRVGAYLIMSQLQSICNSGAIFLTGSAQNLLCVELAKALGVQIASPWVTWLKYSSLPATISLLITPYFIYKIFPPKLKSTPEAPSMAKEKLKQMGNVTRNEWVMIGTMLVTVSLWISGSYIGISSVVAAMIGLSILLILGVLTWEDCLSEKSAWDTFIWFSVLVGMASQLTTLGVVSWVSDTVEKYLQKFSLSSTSAFCVLQFSYFIIHYMFASQTAHVAALYSAFLAMHIAARVPGTLAAFALAYSSNLNGALTHYSSGQAAVYYGAGYLKLTDVFKIGILMALLNIIIWILVGMGWWKLLGLY